MVGNSLQGAMVLHLHQAEYQSQGFQSTVSVRYVFANTGCMSECILAEWRSVSDEQYHRSLVE
jgi:hypothetical protein